MTGILMLEMGLLIVDKMLAATTNTPKKVMDAAGGVWLIWRLKCIDGSVRQS